MNPSPLTTTPGPPAGEQELRRGDQRHVSVDWVSHQEPGELRRTRAARDRPAYSTGEPRVTSKSRNPLQAGLCSTLHVEPALQAEKTLIIVFFEMPSGRGQVGEYR